MMMRAMRKRLIMDPSLEAGCKASSRPRKLRTALPQAGPFYWIEGAPSANAAPTAVICPGAMCAARCGSVNGKGKRSASLVFLAPIGEAGVAQAGADGQHTPRVVVLHRRAIR